MQNKADIQLEEKHLIDLNPAEYNPRYMTDKQREGLDNSLKKFGLVQPIIWNKQTGNIVGGHQRYESLKKAGVEKTKVVVVDLNDEDEKALNVTLNNPSISGEFDQPMLQNMLHEIKMNDEEIFNSLNMDEIIAPDFEDLPDIPGDPQINNTGSKVTIRLPEGRDDLKEELILFLKDALKHNWPNVGFTIK